MMISTTRSKVSSGVFLQPTFRSPLFQPLWNKVHRLALWGMNIGPAGRLADRGEEWALRWCMNQSPSSEPFVLLDAGANKGNYAKDALAIGARRLQVHCFEPSPSTYKQLVANLGGHPQVNIARHGLSDQTAQLQLFSHLGGSAEASLTKRDLSPWGIDQNIVETVEFRRLDDYCAEQKVSRIDLLKLDVEGQEMKALQGASQMIAEKRIRFIQFEFGAPDIEPRTFFRDLFQFLNPHYRVHRIVYQGLSPIDACNEFHETFAAANFLALAR